jgi:hypothetical protein
MLLHSVPQLPLGCVGRLRSHTVSLSLDGSSQRRVIEALLPMMPIVHRLRQRVESPLPSQCPMVFRNGAEIQRCGQMAPFWFNSDLIKTRTRPDFDFNRL